MNRQYEIQRLILIFLFVLYILFMMKILFFKYISLTEFVFNHEYAIRSVNLVPFRSIEEYYNTYFGNNLIANVNVLGNVLIFAPLGVYTSMYFDKYSLLKCIIIGMITSIAVEVVQYTLAIGVTDIDDVILNTLGVSIGVLTYQYLVKRCQIYNKIHLILIAIAIVLIVMFICTTIAVNAQGII